MAPKINSSICLSATFALSILTAACTTTPSQQAASIIDKFDDNAKILTFKPAGDDPHMMAVHRNGDTYAVVRYDLAENSCDTIASHLEYIPQEARQGKENYLVVSVIPDSVANGRSCAIVAYYKMGTPEKELSRYEITNKDKGTVLLPASYMIDDEKGQITVSRTTEDDKEVTDLNVTLDFDGKIVSDKSICIKRPNPALARQAQQGGAVYLWQCDKCGKRLNSSKKPADFYNWGCDGWSHQWVNLGRVN